MNAKGNNVLFFAVTKPHHGSQVISLLMLQLWPGQPLDDPLGRAPEVVG